MTESIQPTSEELEHGAKYGFRIAMRRGEHSSGEIWREPDEVGWRYCSSPTRPAFSRGNPFRKSDTVFFDSEGSPVLVVRRLRFSPPTFEMVEQGATVGRITLRSILRNRYRIEIAPDQDWDFRMPLFSSAFFGVATSGARVFARVATNLSQWLVLAGPSADHARLVFALAFIHNRAWNSG